MSCRNCHLIRSWFSTVYGLDWMRASSNFCYTYIFSQTGKHFSTVICLFDSDSDLIYSVIYILDQERGPYKNMLWFVLFAFIYSLRRTKNHIRKIHSMSVAFYSPCYKTYRLTELSLGNLKKGSSLNRSHSAVTWFYYSWRKRKHRDENRDLKDYRR